MARTQKTDRIETQDEQQALDIIKQFQDNKKVNLPQLDEELLQNTPDDFKGVRERDEQFTVFLKQYIKNYKKDAKARLKMKKRFFGVILGLLCVLLIGSVVSIIICACGVISGTSVMVVAIASIIELISSIISLPLIIAKHLFPKSADDKTKDMMNSLLNHDIRFYDIINKKSAKEVNKKMKEKEDKDKNFNNRIN